MQHTYQTVRRTPVSAHLLSYRSRCTGFSIVSTRKKRGDLTTAKQLLLMVGLVRALPKIGSSSFGCINLTVCEPQSARDVKASEAVHVQPTEVVIATTIPLLWRSAHCINSYHGASNGANFLCGASLNLNECHAELHSVHWQLSEAIAQPNSPSEFGSPVRLSHWRIRKETTGPAATVRTQDPASDGRESSLRSIV